MARPHLHIMKQNGPMLKPELDNGKKMTGYWLASLVLILAGSLIPFNAIIANFYGLDTLAHVILYSVLSFVPMVLLADRKNAFLASIAITPLGYLFETINVVVTGEPFHALNALANNAGVILGIATGFVVRLKNHYEMEKNHEASKQ
ncbi:hypothetical protein OO006_13485 [Prosthecochloris sp. SCSIO W1101]|uniref:hypothetical protein n=1 Tax=Prosthecochloris sp. SCSIO W1101 TaxID=2992242 RepID=UPI00223E414A|nr:hypothetical protein [Prosthecochloris sp. SCSIO W1101]UZJ41335.1 hypothetical protein OO006_13485 [Prosthecochloris sp. SCSIO W1101]